MPTLTLNLLQTTTHWHDPAANRAHFEARFDALPKDGDLVVLPEMFSTGFTMASEIQAETMDGPTVRWLQASARHLGRAVCGSMVIEDGGRFYNRFLLVTPEGGLEHYDKRHRFRMAGEHEHYAAGTERVVLEYLGFRILPQVCYDLRFPVFSRSQEDYDLLIYVANWPAARALAWQTLLRARAIENLSFSVGVNRIGTDGNGVRYTGGSAVLHPDGTALVDLGARSEIGTVTLDLDELGNYRQGFPAWRDRDAFELAPASP